MTQLSLKFTKGKRGEIKLTVDCKGGKKIEFAIKDSTTNAYVLRAEALKIVCRLLSDTRRASGLLSSAVFEVRYKDNLFHLLLDSPERIKFAKKSCKEATQVLSSLGRGCFTFIRD
jgi:hypothetical protein